MPKERNKADGYREKVPIKREKIDACIDSSEREHTRPAACGYDLQNHHHALADAEACAAIVLYIL